VAKARSVYFCTGCGFESARWLGRCPSCEAWNTFEDAPVVKPAKSAQARAVAPLRIAGPVPLAAIDDTRVARRRTGMAEFDALLGGGIVPGSLVLLGGPPGAGKSTLLLQIAAQLAKTHPPVVYVCGEESIGQTKLRAMRLNAGDDLLLFAETDLRAVLDALRRERAPLDDTEDGAVRLIGRVGPQELSAAVEALAEAPLMTATPWLALSLVMGTKLVRDGDVVADFTPYREALQHTLAELGHLSPEEFHAAVTQPVDARLDTEREQLIDALAEQQQAPA